MRVEVRPLSEKGQPLTPDKLKDLAPARGQMQIAETRIHSLRRISRYAKLVSDTNGLDSDQTLELLDAEVIWMDDFMLRIRGTERVGSVFYAQTWDVRVLT